MDPVLDRGSMDPVHESGPWTRSKEGVHGPLVHVLSSPAQVRSSSCQTNRKPLVYRTVTIFSVIFRCIQLQITYFLGKDNANVVNFYLKARKTNCVL